MMNDHDNELLKFAAKAAGIKSDECGPYIETEVWCQEFRSVGGWETVKQAWKPLHDDGTALRLAVKLGIVIDTCPPFSPGNWCVHVSFNSREECLVEYCEQGYEKLIVATRRAIVKAAAEIGRRMK